MRALCPTEFEQVVDDQELVRLVSMKFSSSDEKGGGEGRENVLETVNEWFVLLELPLIL